MTPHRKPPAHQGRSDRHASYDSPVEALRSTTLRGSALTTNLEFHYGLVNWFLGRNVMAKPTTRFVVPYLTLVGTLKEEANRLDPVYAFLQMKKHYDKLVCEQYADQPEVCAKERKHMSALLDRKGTLITRPMERLLEDPHLLSGWLSMNTTNFRIEKGRVIWLRNPLGVLNETYEYCICPIARTSLPPRSYGAMTTSCCSSRCISTAPCARSWAWRATSISNSRTAEKGTAPGRF